MINISMKLSEIANTKNIKLKDSKRVEYKTLKQIRDKNTLMEYIDNGGDILEALKIPRHDLPRHIASQVEDKMSKDSAFMQDIIKELGIEVVVDKQSNMVTIFDASDVKDPGHQSQLFVGDPGRKPKLPEQDWDNPTNDELKRDQEDADRMMDLKRASDYNKKFDWAPKYLSNTEAHKKPYHFIDPATGKTSGEGPYYGIVFGKLPQNDREWMKLGFTKAVNNTWFINNQYLKKLVDQGVIG